MRHVMPGVAVLCLVLPLPASVSAQTSGFPDISQRSYTTGSASVTVTGSVKIDEEIPINAPASFSDGRRAGCSTAHRDRRSRMC